MDAKSDMEKKVLKIRKKRLRACILALRTAFWTVQGTPGTSQERPKSGSRGPQKLRTNSVGRFVTLWGALGALLKAFLRFFVISLSFLVDFWLICAMILARFCFDFASIFLCFLLR